MKVPYWKGRGVDEEFWNRMYDEREQVWSGRPNGVLVTEVADLVPGRALDVGCGEGGDSRWLAEHGWEVTGVDISGVALARAREFCAGLKVTVHHQDLTLTPPEQGAFDLVSAHYFALPKQGKQTALRGLLDAVAPGGTLLIVGHDFADLHDHEGHGPDPEEFHRPDEVAALLGKEWDVEVNEVRPRVDPSPEGASHVRDTVLRARRRG